MFNDFFFDLNGFLILKEVADPDLLARLNTRFDEFPRELAVGAWLGGAQRRDYTPKMGLELHQAVALGEPFEELIDHPSWIDLVPHYCGEEQFAVQGMLTDESIASIREAPSGSFRWFSRRFAGQISL